MRVAVSKSANRIESFVFWDTDGCLGVLLERKAVKCLCFIDF